MRWEAQVVWDNVPKPLPTRWSAEIRIRKRKTTNVANRDATHLVHSLPIQEVATTVYQTHTACFLVEERHHELPDAVNTFTVCSPTHGNWSCHLQTRHGVRSLQISGPSPCAQRSLEEGRADIGVDLFATVNVALQEEVSWSLLTPLPVDLGWNNTSAQWKSNDVCVFLVTSMYFNQTGNDSSLGTFLMMATNEISREIIFSFRTIQC